MEQLIGGGGQRQLRRTGQAPERHLDLVKEKPGSAGMGKELKDAIKVNLPKMGKCD